jgi:hypothetical protein
MLHLLWLRKLRFHVLQGDIQQRREICQFIFVIMKKFKVKSGPQTKLVFLDEITIK